MKPAITNSAAEFIYKVVQNTKGGDKLTTFVDLLKLPYFKGATANFVSAANGRAKVKKVVPKISATNAFKAAGVKRAEKRGAKVAAKSVRSKLRKAMTVISATNTLKAAGAKYAEKRETAKAADKTGE